jgi:pimeloyl-ACP methyl ester carboxylesterase
VSESARFPGRVNQLETHFVQVNGVNLHVKLAGPRSGRPLLLLHGFPDFWYGWRFQIDALVAAGHRLIIPDQRGYNLSDKPEGTASYDLGVLADDVLGLLDEFAIDRTQIVAHDFGGAVAWWFAANHAERVERMVVINCPHFAAFRSGLLTPQVFRSYYMLTMQFGRASEWFWRRNDFAMCEFIGPGTRVGGMREDDRGPYHEAWSQPGALRGMFGWYRAIGPRLLGKFPNTRIAPPTLLIWGKRDPALSLSLAQTSIDHADHGKLIVLDETHWVHWDVPDHVNPMILDWLDQSPDT